VNAVTVATKRRPPRHEQQQRQHKPHVIDAEQNVLHAKHEIGAHHFE
jgi:hypothetical protein